MASQSLNTSTWRREPYFVKSPAWISMWSSAYVTPPPQWIICRKENRFLQSKRKKKKRRANLLVAYCGWSSRDACGYQRGKQFWLFCGHSVGTRALTQAEAEKCPLSSQAVDEALEYYYYYYYYDYCSPPAYDQLHPPPSSFLSCPEETVVVHLTTTLASLLNSLPLPLPPPLLSVLKRKEEENSLQKAKMLAQKYGAHEQTMLQ